MVDPVEEFNGQFLYLNQHYAPILFKEEVLGSVCGVDINGHIGRVALPTLDRSDDREGFQRLGPPSSYSLGGLPNQYRRYEPLDWGYPFVMPSGESFVRAMLFEFSLPLLRDETRSQITKIEEHFDDWFDLLRDWLEVLSHQDLNIDDPFMQTKKLGNFIWAIHDGSEWSGTTVGARMVVSGPSIETAMSLEQWKHAISMANASVRPPEPYLLLRDARARSNRSDTAIAVIIASTACEIVISQTVTRTMEDRGLPEAFIGEILDRAGLSRLITYGRKLGMTFPQNIAGGLVEKRNRAAHENAFITREEAKTAIDTAEAILKSMFPLV